MARGPFQGTYRAGVRPTVVTAPDALVYINGETDLVGCPQCKRRFDLNKYITNIQVDLNVDSAPGSASINLSVPRHSIDDLYFDGNLLLVPMMEIEIFAKGYYLIEGLPQYYPIFWGMITEVNDSYSGGEHSISINCSDILKWWELCKMNINPAFTGATAGMNRNIFGNVFYGTNPYDIIWTLAQQSFGDVVVGSGSLVSLYKEASQKDTFATALSDIMLYWQRRFTRMRSNLLLYGTTGATVRGDVLFDEYQNGRRRPRNSRPFASAAVRKANGSAGQMVYDPTDSNVVAFRTQGTNAGQINLWQSEYQTKLELANAAKEAIGFEFFMDVDGSIVFKPPFYNLDVLPNKPVSWIQDIDVIDWDFSESEAEVVTQIVMQGGFSGNEDWGTGEELTPFTSVTDYHLLRKYGWRQQTFNSEFMGDTQMMFYVGMDMLDRYNARRHRATVSIPLRPELRLGFPVYVAPKDQFWYVQGISHNIQFGGRAQTTVTLTAKRQKFISPKGIGNLKLTGLNTDLNPKKNKVTELSTDELSAATLSGRDLTAKASFELTVGDAAQIPPSVPTQEQVQSGNNPYEPLILRHPKTGRIVGYPNVIMAYTRPYAPPPDDLRRNAGQNKDAAKRAARLYKSVNEAGKKQIEDLNNQMYSYQKSDALRDDTLTHRYSYGLNSNGVYTYAYDSSQKIQEIIFPPKSRVTAKVSGQTDPAFFGKGQKGSAMIRPVSDERGFEVIGHFRYGRGVSLRDGSLILSENNNGKNEGANIDTQVALSGGLFEMLSTQSQGITTVTSKFANPAEAIARLQPEELQTAGRINPETKKPEFNADTDGLQLIADTAPLGSLAQKGLPTTVEASQLSRALTLAEMAVKEAPIPNDECPCLLGRADLAFINVGYQVKTLFNSSTAGDTSKLPSSQGGTTSEFGLLSPELVAKRKAILEKSTEIAEAKTIEEKKRLLKEAADQLALYESDPIVMTDPEALATAQKARALFESASFQEGIDVGSIEAGTQAGLAAIEQLTGGTSAGDLFQQEEVAAALAEGLPVKGASVPSGKDLQLRVEQFLVNLYAALDPDHQQFEKALRGELLPQGTLNPEQIRFPDQFAPDQKAPFAPPFNAPNRALGGDPEALALAAKSNLGDIQKTWSDFGNKLSSNTQKAKLEQEIKNDQAKLERLQARKAELENFLSGPNQQPKFAGDPQQQLDDINKQISQVEQSIAKKQTKANQLP